MTRLAHLGAGALLVVLAWLPSIVLADKGAWFLPPIDIRQAALFVAAAWWGWPGWLGATLAFTATVGHPLEANAWAVVSLLPVVGAVGAVVLPHLVPRFDRTLRQPWSLAAAAIAAAAWAFLAAGVQSRLVFADAMGSAWAVWGVSLLCTYLVGVVPVVAGVELVSQLRRAVAPSTRQLLRIGVFGALAIAAGVGGSWLSQQLPVTRMWVALLMLVPVVVAARWWSSAGGVLAAALVGAGYLQAGAQQGVGIGSHHETVEQAGLVATLWVVGALLGVSSWRQNQLISTLRGQQELLARDLERVVRALSGAVEAKDQYTEGHLQRVTHYAVRAGTALGLERQDLEMLRIAATLHDVGKIGIPGSILKKPGPLSDDEYREMMRHPEIGARLLGQLDGFERAAELVLHHQERYDGRRDGPFPGYPAGLAGEAIPLGSRIVAVVDAFDAMTTDRPYRRALPLEVAKDVLRRESGQQFDPRVVDVFLQLVEAEPWFGEEAR
jgi:HD-GYP domain-containing protein (c-di-GMP phosphodiesterase class II)